MNHYNVLGSGSSCSTAIEHMPRDREVVGSNPDGCWAFFSLLFLSLYLSLSISGVCLIRITTDFPGKMYA